MADPSGAPPRLMIREMVLENFKSYAGIQRVGPFHKSFSAVVGPNGSGKSNVIDAMLFVFGRRAKQLRFNKISELIHNSSNHRDCESARVTVHFQEIIDKDDGFEVIPGSEFSVSRTAHRSNQSDYYINDRKVPSKDVADKLKSKGIDLDNNRFLILQGEVEQISMMKPKAEDKNDTGLLEYLEDIIGTDKYIEGIQTNAKQLEELNEKRQSMIQRLKVSEKERDALESKKQEAELFLDKQARMLRHRMSAAKISALQIEAALAETEEARTKLEEKLQHEREKHKAYDQNWKERQKKFQAAEKQFQAANKAVEAANERFKELERKDAQLQMDIKHTKTKLKKVAAKMESDAASIKKLESEGAALEAELPGSQEAVQKLTAELAQQEEVLEGMLEAIKGEVEGYHQQLSEVRAQLAPWEKRVGEVSSRIGVAAAERDMLAKRGDDAQRRLDAALKGLAAAQQSAQAKSRQIQELEAAAGRLRQQLEQQRSQLQTLRGEEAKQEAAAREARERAAALRQDASAAQQQSGLVTALMAAKAKGEVSGVFGRLGDLGAIDKQFDVAVSTAVGALDYIVVETASDAQKCVEYLRKNQMGVATFLILEKQRHLAATAAERVQTPEGAPRLFDLIKIKDEALRPAFYFAMGNTLVAQDLDQASKIAYDRNSRFRRVVTMQGQLIAESGTMSGGGGRPSRGRMQLGSSAPRGNVDAKAAAAELAAAEQQLEQANQSLRAARDQVSACEQSIKAAERQLAELELSVPKARMEAEAEAAKANDIQHRLDELKAATKLNADDVRRISELGAEMQKEEASLTQLKAQMAGLEEKAAELQRKIDGAGGEKLKKQKALAARLQKDISEAEAEAARKAVQVKTSAKSLDKLRKEGVKDAAEKTKLTDELARLDAAVKAMEDEAAEAMQAVHDKTAELETINQQVEATRAEREQFQGELGAIQRAQVNIEAQLEQLSKRQKDEGARLRELGQEINKNMAELIKVTGNEQEQVPTAEELQGQTADDNMYHAGILESEMQKMSPDMEAIELFRAKDAEYSSRAAELEEATNTRDTVRRAYEELRKRRLDEFMVAFNIISLKLKEMYQMITLGGDAELELVDSLDPFSEGIVFSVRPPRKSWKNISNLSGGEKTLSSLSLVFALHHYKPTPLYVMDEIDAALDFKNVSIVGHYVKDRTRDAQFVIISLRNNMFELADRLVGIYKTDNATKTVTINPAEFAAGATQEQGKGQEQGKEQEQGQEEREAAAGGHAPMAVEVA